jgi:MFS family permease
VIWYYKAFYGFGDLSAVTVVIFSPTKGMDMQSLPVRNQRSLRFLTLSQAGLFAANGLTIPLMANHFATLGAGPALVGIMFAAQQFGSLAAPYLWGLRSDRIGQRRPIIMLALGLAASAMLVIALTRIVWLVVVAQLVLGVATAGFNAGSLALAGDLIEDATSRGRMLGFFRTTGSLAFACTAIMGGFMADTAGLWVPIVIAAIMLAIGCVAALGIREATESAVRVPDVGTDVASHASNFPVRTMVVYFAVVFTWFYGMGAVAWQWPAFMHSLGYSQSLISGLWALAAAGEVPGLILAGFLADRWGRRPLLMTGLIGQGAIYVLYQFVAPMWGIFPLQMLRSLTYSSYETPALLVATELGLRQRRGRLAGLYHTIAALGGVIGSMIGGQIVAGYGYAVSFTAAGIIMIVVALVVARRLPRVVRTTV